MKNTRLNLSEREKYEIAQEMKDIVYDMDSFSYRSREAGHMKLRKLTEKLGEDNMNILLDEFTIWDTANNILQRGTYLKLRNNILTQIHYGKEYEITDEDTLIGFNMPKTKWLVNAMEMM